jgi:hypothetical protein
MFASPFNHARPYSNGGPDTLIWCVWTSAFSISVTGSGGSDTANWLMLNPSPDRNDGPAARRKHASHFPGGGEFVGHELKSLLTQHEIERRLLEWKFLGAPLSPFDRRARRQWKGSGNLQHLRADVQPGDRAVGADQGSDLAGDNAGATGHIEDTFARAGFRTAEKLFRPRQEHRGHKVRLIRIRWIRWCFGAIRCHSGPPVGWTGTSRGCSCP